MPRKISRPTLCMGDLIGRGLFDTDPSTASLGSGFYAATTLGLLKRLARHEPQAAEGLQNLILCFESGEYQNLLYELNHLYKLKTKVKDSGGEKPVHLLAQKFVVERCIKYKPPRSTKRVHWDFVLLEHYGFAKELLGGLKPKYASVALHGKELKDCLLGLGRHMKDMGLTCDCGAPIRADVPSVDTLLAWRTEANNSRSELAKRMLAYYHDGTRLTMHRLLSQAVSARFWTRPKKAVRFK